MGSFTRQIFSVALHRGLANFRSTDVRGRSETWDLVRVLITNLKAQRGHGLRTRIPLPCLVGHGINIVTGRGTLNKLVDDVCTTGATLTQCALALRARGCEQVHAVTVAKALGHEITADV